MDTKVYKELIELQGRVEEHVLTHLKFITWTTLAVQWLRLCTSSAGGVGSIPCRGTRIPDATWHGQKKKENYHLD